MTSLDYDGKVARRLGERSGKRKEGKERFVKGTLRSGKGNQNTNRPARVEFPSKVKVRSFLCKTAAAQSFQKLVSERTAR